LSTAKYCKQKNISATFACTKDNEPELADYDVTILKNNELANHTQPSCVLGTTAWGFAREDMAAQLDYLLVPKDHCLPGVCPGRADPVAFGHP
jgi:uncharacterized protein